MSSRLKIVLTLAVNADISAALLGAGASASSAASSSAKICVGDRVARGAVGATNAVAAVARVARRASFMVSLLFLSLSLCSVRLNAFAFCTALCPLARGEAGCQVPRSDVDRANLIDKGASKYVSTHLVVVAAIIHSPASITAKVNSGGKSCRHLDRAPKLKAKQPKPCRFVASVVEH